MAKLTDEQVKLAAESDIDSIESFGAYQKAAEITNCYPAPKRLEILTLGLCSEAGEVAGKVKKLHRDGDIRVVQILDECGDVLWYLSQIAREFEIDLTDVARMNLKKLRRRALEGTIGGSGDGR